MNNTLNSADQEKLRWRDTFAKIPADRQDMAQTLLSKSNLSSAEIVKACTVGVTASLDAVTDPANLYTAGQEAAKKALGKIDCPPEFAVPKQTKQDLWNEEEIAAGEEAARHLLPMQGGTR